jgi:hypothetical protein
LEWSFENIDGVGVELEWLTPGVAHLWLTGFSVKLNKIKFLFKNFN